MAMPAMVRMIAITIKSSIRVKPEPRALRPFLTSDVAVAVRSGCLPLRVSTASGAKLFVFNPHSSRQQDEPQPNCMVSQLKQYQKITKGTKAWLWSTYEDPARWAWKPRIIGGPIALAFRTVWCRVTKVTNPSGAPNTPERLCSRCYLKWGLRSGQIRQKTSERSFALVRAQLHSRPKRQSSSSR